MKYLDKTGLTYLWSKIKSKIPTKTSELTNDSNYITSSGSTSGNAGSATKLQTGRTIGIGTGGTGTATSFDGSKNITIPLTDVKDSYVTWGGKSMTTLSPNDMGCVDEFGHNKLAFLPASKISVEYTTDGGTTWIDYGLTDAQKVALVTTNGPACRIGKGTVSAKNGTMTNENCANYKVRVTLTGVGSLYTKCKKILLNMSTDGANGCKLKIEARTYTDYNAGNDTWRDIATYDVAGWSGWNSLPVSTTYGGANSWSDAQLRFTLSITSVNTAYTCQAQLIDFRMIGINNWSTPSELARAGHIYKIDTDQSALFPANITPQVNNSKTLGTSSLKWNNVYATTFTGNLTGTATKATGDKNGADITTTYYKASNPNGYTSNTGTITGITMNGASKGTSGVVDLGTVITAHQDISGKQDKITSTNKLDYSLLSNTPTIPSAVTESTVSGWGFTKNIGTITTIALNGVNLSTQGLANIPAATTDKYGITKLSNATNSTSEVLAATPKAVKSAYDTAEAAASVASSASASAQNAYDLASVASSASAEALSDIGDMSGLIGGSDIVGAIDTLNVGLTNRPTIETGTGTNGSYIKYSNGILICYGTITGTSSLSDYWSQFNRSAENISFDFPYEFASRPMVNYTSYNYGTVSIVSGRNTTTQGKFTVLKPKNISNTSYEFDYIAIGTWE